MTRIERVGVVGAGTMGSGIAEVCAKAGFPTTVVEAAPEFLETGRTRIESSMAKAVDRARLDAADRDAALARLVFDTDAGALANVDLVVEAISEDRAAKFGLFAQLDEITPGHAILASNTSSIPIVELGMATGRPRRVIGVHFFNPAVVQKLVEVIPSTVTDDAVTAAVRDFVGDRLGKTVVVTADRAGFIVNRLLIPYLLQSIELLDSGVNTAEEIDTAMKLGCAHPMGPLELCDLIGLDIVAGVADVLFDEFHERHYAAPPLLRRLVAAGHLGRKSGVGFHQHS
jgi:3-hydroxybutyryl-CoA dehydrogenase